MASKITDYPAKTTFNDGDLYDVSTFDGITTYTSEKMTFAELKTKLLADLGFLPLTGGSMTGAIYSPDGNDYMFIGDLYYSIGIDGNERFIVQSTGLNTGNVSIHSDYDFIVNKTQMTLGYQDLISLAGFGSTSEISFPDLTGTVALTVQEIGQDITTSYTAIIEDAGQITTLSNAAAVAYTIPTNASVAFDIGTKIDLLNLGAGVVTIGGAGVTINQNIGGLTMAQYDKRTLVKVATDTWIVGY
jgi:hypothetical protein